MCPINLTSASGPSSYVEFNLVLFLVYVMYVLITITCWWIYHRQRVYLNKRSFMLMSISGLSGIIEFVIVPLREYIGQDMFPCDLYLWLNVFLIPLVVGPIVLQFAVFSYRSEFNQRVGALDNSMIMSVFQNSHMEAIRQRRRTTIAGLHKKRKTVMVESTASSSMIEDMTKVTDAESIIHAKQRFSERHAARMVLLGMVIPVLIIGICLTLTSTEYGHGCRGCSTSTTELYILILETLYLIGLGVYFGWQTRQLPDPWYILRGTRNVLLFGFIIGFIGLGLSTLDPYELSTTKQFDWGWIVCLAIGVMHTLFCVRPLWHSQDTIAMSGNISLEAFRQKLHDAQFHQAFRAFSLKLFTIENIMFWDMAQALIHAPELDLDAKTVIDAVFINDDAPMQLNLSAFVREAYISNTDWRGSLEVACLATLKLMHSDTMPKFIQTEEGKRVMGDVV